MKDYAVPLQKRLLILTILGLPFVFELGTAVGIALPMAAWFLWGEWRVFRVNAEGFYYRKSWFRPWSEVAWDQVLEATWTGPDRVCFKLVDGSNPRIVFGGLEDRDCLEVAGWIDRYSACGLRREPEGDPGWSTGERTETSQ